MQTYTLHQLNEYVRRVLALNFSESLWVSCEIFQVREARGHFFFELAEKSPDSEEIVAQSQAVCWKTTYRKLRRQIGRELPSLFREGMEVCLLVRLDFHERYGLKLIIENVDTSYTLGQLEQQRRLVLQQLETAGHIGRNARLPLTCVLQRVAILGAEKSAGLQDFITQLTRNSPGYRYFTKVFPVTVQGKRAETEIIRQLRSIERHRREFDCVVIIRGGGSRIDLAAFDSLSIAEAIALFPIPVLTGVGHDIDETVADKVAFLALKTPTAAAEWLIQYNSQFEASVIDLGHQVQYLGQRLLTVHQLQLERLEQRLQAQTAQCLIGQHQRLQYLSDTLNRSARTPFQSNFEKLDQLERLLRLLSPEATLRRGFSLTLRDGKAIGKASELKNGETITTRFQDGEVDSEIK